jgi:predicted AlkP superfamily phosphohydrolase/phosphomutase/tetratricopeptide (TPR) repeat protein
MSSALAKKLLLIGWDAADWQMIHPLMDAGRMPNLQRIVDGGISGNILTLQPILSPILWTSIATGKRAPQHGILGFVEPTPDGTGLRPVSSTSRKCKAIWNILTQAGKRCHAIGWYASHPAEAISGVCVSNQFCVAPPSATPDNWPLASASVAPASAGDAIADLRIHPDEIPLDLIQQFIPHAAGLNTAKPAVAHLLRALSKRLAECLTIHAVATDLMEHHPWDFCTVYYEAIDQIGHDFMVYHPPQMRHLPDDVFLAFSNVMTAVYELQDKLLGRLLELAGEDAHVMIVSDHGFLSGARRPTEPVDAARWHRNFGMIAARGAGLKRDELLRGATLLDIAPTILTLFGLPVGQDMEGKVLVNAFERMPEIARIESREKVDDPNAPPREISAADDPEVAAEAMRQLVELGYLDAPGEDVLRNIARARAEQRFNLAASLMDGRRASDALLITAQLMRDFPDEMRHAVLHGQAAVPLADPGALEQAIAALERLAPDNRQLELFRGFLASFRGDEQAALRHFQNAGERTPDDPWVHCRVGRACLRLRRWAEAEAAFRRSEELDPDNPEAAYGLSVAVARQGRPQEAVEHGLRAVGQLHDFPLAHFQLGAVLSRLSLYERAAQAFEICIAMRPQFALAHRYLARIYSQLGRVLEARDARDTAARLLAANVPQPPVD